MQLTSMSEWTTEEAPCEGTLLTSDTVVSELTDCTSSESNTATNSTNNLTVCEENSLFESNELRTIFGLHHSDTPTPMKHLLTPDTFDRELPTFSATGAPGDSGITAGNFFGRFRCQSTSPMDTHRSIFAPAPKRNLFESIMATRENCLFDGATRAPERVVKPKANAAEEARILACSRAISSALSKLPKLRALAQGEDVRQRSDSIAFSFAPIPPPVSAALPAPTALASLDPATQAKEALAQLIMKRCGDMLPEALQFGGLGPVPACPLPFTGTQFTEIRKASDDDSTTASSATASSRSPKPSKSKACRPAKPFGRPAKLGRPKASCISSKRSKSPAKAPTSTSPHKRAKPSSPVPRRKSSSIIPQNQRCSQSVTKDRMGVESGVYPINIWPTSDQCYHTVSPTAATKHPGLLSPPLSSTGSLGGDVTGYFDDDLDASDLGMLDFLDEDAGLLADW